MINKINFLNLIGAIVCFVFAFIIVKGTNGVFVSVDNEMVTFVISCMVGMFFLTGVKK